MEFSLANYVPNETLIKPIYLLKKMCNLQAYMAEEMNARMFISLFTTLLRL